jgi:hypothetical protein
MSNDTRYPIGRFQSRTELTADERRALIDEIAATPAAMREAVRGLTDAQLDTQYREGGWTLRQVAHHLPDSHMNAYCRMKFALTESEPTIRPYDEDAWARLADTRETPVEVSVALLESLHARWVTLLRSLRDEDFRRTFRHPDHEGMQTVDWIVAFYSWHGRHHTTHITSARERHGW